MDEEETAELRNPFPSPPSHYTKYTSHNLNLLALLKERSPDDQDVNQLEILKDQNDVPDWPLLQLEKPRVDWILEEPDAHYDVYGDRWFVKETIPSLADMGGNQLYPADPTIDRRPALLSILRSLLVTYSDLTGALLAPPPVSTEIPPDWQRNIEWITVLSQNLMAAANDLRPVQARGNLESMLRRQLELRREETQKLHDKCDTLSAKLTELRLSLQKALSQNQPTKKAETLISTTKQAVSPQMHAENTSMSSLAQIPSVEVLNWAEQV